MPERVLLAARGVFFFAVAFWLVVAPYWRQIEKVKTPYINRWVMFVGFGLDICDARYVQVTPEGRVPLDRYEVLGYDGPSDAPGSLRKLTKPRRVESVGKQLCRAKRAEDPDIRIFGRCASRKGWKRKFSGRQSVCDPYFGKEKPEPVATTPPPAAATKPDAPPRADAEAQP